MSPTVTFQWLMEQIIHGLHWISQLLYLDNIIVIAPDLSTFVTFGIVPEAEESRHQVEVKQM